MNHEEKLTGLIEKYRKNREKVPLEVLKTKYAAAYNQLIEDIKAELKHIALQFPPWLEGRKVRREYVDDISDIFNRIYAEGGYSKMLGRLAFKEMEADAALYTAQQINKKFIAALEEYVSSKACLYATASCWIPEHPQTPKIYNDFLRMFWDEERKEWREPEPGEQEPAILIFLNKGEKKE